jgi:hypothetical protein
MPTRNHDLTVSTGVGVFHQCWLWNGRAHAEESLTVKGWQSALGGVAVHLFTSMIKIMSEVDVLVIKGDR